MLYLYAYVHALKYICTYIYVQISILESHYFILCYCGTVVYTCFNGLSLIVREKTSVIFTPRTLYILTEQCWENKSETCYRIPYHSKYFTLKEIQFFKYNSLQTFN